MSETITQFSIDIAVAIIILSVGIWLANKLKAISVNLMSKKGLDPLLANFAGSIAHVLLVIVVVIASLSQLGIQTTSLIAVLGAAGLAVGLALQGSLSNFASGVIIIALRPFKVGDFVEAGGVSGIVEGIQMFSTSMRTPDNKAVIVPNSSITSSTITNYSAKDTRRVDMVFSIAYHDDIAAAKIILQGLLDKDERLLKEPAPIIAVSALADNSVNLIVRPWVKTDDYWPVYWDMMEKVKL
ncbi:MAG: mechanosensitive ion channel domain-containing protein, partial [Gammaproteobacteria bacterium]